jgi:Flp pilus assembly pilin Flp
MRGSRSERGATLVEYTLLVALVTVVGIPAFDFLRHSVLDHYERPAGYRDRNDEVVAPPPSTTAPPVTVAPTTTTTSPPTTTTTAPPPTTTTRPPATTTTTAPRVVASATFSNATSWANTWYRWSGSAQVRVTDASGRVLAGAEVEIRITAGGSERTVTVTTDSTGRATVDVGPYDYLYGYGTGSAGLRVVGVDAPNGTWDGNGRTTTIYAP